jgi:tetratricopeptide (TPR) repeat protein
MYHLTNCMKRTLFPLVVLAFVLAQCKPEEQKVTTEEVTIFIKEMENGAVKRKPDLITSQIIMQALTDRMLNEKDIKNIAELAEGMQKGIRNSELDRSVYSTIGKNGSFEKVKSYEKNGVQRVIFRMFGDNGLNYLDMELTKLENKVGIADVFSYISGENLSRTMADLASRLTDGVSERKAQEAIEAFQAVKRLMAKENFKQAKKEFDRLPGYLKNTRMADIMNIQISSNLDEAVSAKEMKHFEMKYAGEPSLQLSMIDLYLVQKDFDKAIKSIDILDSLINNDSFLDYYRGLIMYSKGEPEKAVEYYKKVTLSNPAFPGAYEQLVAWYITQDDQENSKQYFEKYKKIRNADSEMINSYETAYPFLKD